MLVVEQCQIGNVEIQVRKPLVGNGTLGKVELNTVVSQFFRGLDFDRHSSVAHCKQPPERGLRCFQGPSWSIWGPPIETIMHDGLTNFVLCGDIIQTRPTVTPVDGKFRRLFPRSLMCSRLIRPSLLLSFVTLFLAMPLPSPR